MLGYKGGGGAGPRGGNEERTAVGWEFGIEWEQVTLLSEQMTLGLFSFLCL